jgi:hypothetical protein
MSLWKKFWSWGGFAPGEHGFVQTALLAAPYILNALGGIFGKKKRYVSPEELKQKFGAKAITGDATDLANYILSSPYGQELLASAAEQGQGIERETNARAAASGLGAGTGADSGASIFATGAASQAAPALQRQVRSNVLQGVLPIAAGQQPALMAQYLKNVQEQNAELSPFQKIAGAAGQAVSAIPHIKKPGEEE